MLEQRTPVKSTSVTGPVINTMEKRSLVRNPMHIYVACGGLTTRCPSVFSQGRMMNCSGGGACIELDHKIHIGTIVIIKVANCGIKELPEGLRTLALAEVKWSKRLEDTQISNYAIGLKYLPN